MPENDPEELARRLDRLVEAPFTAEGDPRELLRRCLRHEREELKTKAARLAGSLAEGSLIKPLFELIASEAPLEARRAGVEALGELLHRGRMSDLHREVPEEGPPIREQGPLSSQQFRAVRDFLGRLIQETDWPEELRAEALPHYAPLAPEEAASWVERFHAGDLVLRELGRADTDRRRLEAVRAASTHGILDAVPQLLRLLREARDEEVRRETARAVARLWEGASPRELKRFTGDDDPKVREALYRHEQRR